MTDDEALDLDPADQALEDILIEFDDEAAVEGDVTADDVEADAEADVEVEADAEATVE